MKKNLFYISLITGLLALSACSKLLEEKSQSDVIPKTAQDFKELLVGSGYIGNNDPAKFINLLDDDMDFNVEYPDATLIGSDGVKAVYPTYTWQPYFLDRDGLGVLISQDPANTAYAVYYERIKGCNAVLDNIDNSIGTQMEKDRVKGEALALRAHYYFTLVNLFGDPYSTNPAAFGVPLKLNSGITAEFPERATVGQVYDQMVKDLKEASRLMDPLTISRRDYHINQPAIHILLSRVYLHMQNWQGVVDEANKVFELGGMLYDLKAQTTAPYLSYANPEVEWMFGGFPEPASPSAFVASREFRATFAPADKRLTLGYSVSPNNSSVLVTKYIRGGIDLIQSIRTGEAVLNRAEAYVQLNKLGDAAKDLNDLRRTRIPGYVDVALTDKTQALDSVRIERRKEFCHEGFRWFDLRRYGMPAIQHRYVVDKGQPVVYFKLQEKDPMYTLPFPTSLVLRNPALKQNPSATMPERQQQ